jgi:hypothetical protein
MEIKLPDIPLIKNYPRTIVVIFVVFFLIVSLLVENSSPKTTEPAEVPPAESVDTFIPSGFVLVPIEVQNLASLDSIVGQYGVVDLYTENEKNPLASGLKLIRSPRDPSQFAVMVPEISSREVVKYSNKPFMVIVQNPNHAKSSVRNPTPPTRIIWED